MKHQISVSHALSYGFRSVFNNFGAFFIPFLLMFGIIIGCILGLALVMGIGAFLFTYLAFPLIATCIIGVSVITLALTASYIKALMNWKEGNQINVSLLPNPFAPWLGMMLYMFLVAAGLVCLIIPGVFFLVRFHFFIYPMVEENCGVLESFSKSYDATKGHFWKLLGAIIIESLLMYFWIITYPALQLSMIHLYRQLTQSLSISKE